MDRPIERGVYDAEALAASLMCVDPRSEEASSWLRGERGAVRDDFDVVQGRNQPDFANMNPMVTPRRRRVLSSVDLQPDLLPFFLYGVESESQIELQGAVLFESSES